MSVIEDAVDLRGVCDESNYAHRFTASGTLQRLNLEIPSQQLGPASPRLAQRLGARVDPSARLFLRRFLVSVGSRASRKLNGRQSNHHQSLTRHR